MVNCDLTDVSSLAGQHPRVCAVSYLNTVPLVWGMLHGPQRSLFDLDFAIPSECADRLERGLADIGIVPTAETYRLGLELIPGSGIACEGPVRSILLISRVPLPQIRSLAADVSSRTSVQLARIVLLRKYGVEPAITAMPPDLPSMLETADAALIIGDPALRIDPNSVPFHVADLGEEWRQMTGLPFVFAVWAGKPAVVTPALTEHFTGSLRHGLANLEAIIESESVRRGITPELARKYLTSHIRFELGPREYEGMNLFLSCAPRLGHVQRFGEVPA